MRPSREQKFVLSMLRCSLGYETPSAAERMWGTDLVWGRIKRLSIYHGISHLILSSVRKNSRIELPSDVLDAFEKEYLVNSAMHLLHEEALKEILARMEGLGIPVAVHKGLGLSALLYPEPELRPCGSDLDILVRKEDYKRVRSGLKEIGYGLTNPEYEAHEIEYIGEVKFQKEMGGRKVVVDLHTDLVANHWGKVTRFRMEGFWDRLLRVQYNDFTIPYLPVDVYLFFLCIHCAANHIFDRLITLCDLDLFLRKNEGVIDWDYIGRYAEGSGSRKVLYHPLRCCADMLDSPVPGLFLEKIRPGLLSGILIPGRLLFFREAPPPKALERYMHLVLLDNPLHSFRSIGIFVNRILGERALGKKTGRPLV